MKITKKDVCLHSIRAMHSGFLKVLEVSMLFCPRLHRTMKAKQNQEVFLKLSRFVKMFMLVLWKEELGPLNKVNEAKYYSFRCRQTFQIINFISWKFKIGIWSCFHRSTWNKKTWIWNKKTWIWNKKLEFEMKKLEFEMKKIEFEMKKLEFEVKNL